MEEGGQECGRQKCQKQELKTAAYAAFISQAEHVGHVI